MTSDFAVRVKRSPNRLNGWVYVVHWTKRVLKGEDDMLNFLLELLGAGPIDATMGGIGGILGAIMGGIGGILGKGGGIGGMLGN